MIKKTLCLHLEGTYAVLEATVYVKELREILLAQFIFTKISL